MIKKASKRLVIKAKQFVPALNEIQPNAIVTLTRPLALPLAYKDACFGSETSPVPMMRAGQPCGVSPRYLFLASCDSGYMTGQALKPNGGTIV